jgi:SET domain-containing protein
MTHIKIKDKLIRTPLGGFINHANDPNCVKVELLMTNQDDPTMKFDYKKWNLVTIKDIEKGEELTLKYTFYNLHV